MRLFNKSINTSDKLSILSIIIAIFSLVYTVLQVKLAMDNNRISVIPRISSNLIIDDQEPFSGIGIINDGLGPAIIKDIKFYVADRKIDKLPIQAQTIISSAYKLKDNIIVTPLNPEAILKADKPFWFFKTKKNNEAEAKKLFDMYMEVNIQICYCSLYNECFEKILGGKENPNIPKTKCSL